MMSKRIFRGACGGQKERHVGLYGIAEVVIKPSTVEYGSDEYYFETRNVLTKYAYIDKTGKIIKK
jgi:hypothetical protein